MSERPHLAPLPNVSELVLESLPAIPIWLVTGFLGAGKTTWLNRLLKQPEWEKTAVIVNEMGAVGIDHLILSESAFDPILVGDGCLCCAGTGGLAETLDGLLGRKVRGEVPPFERVVVETSGLADPTAIVAWLVNEAGNFSPFVPGPVITVVNPEMYASIPDHFPEFVRQLEIGDAILLAHRSSVDQRSRQQSETCLRRHTDAPILTTDDPLIPDRFHRISRDSMQPLAQHGRSVSILSIALSASSDPITVELALREVVARCPGTILRLKSLIQEGDTAGMCRIIDFVQGQWNAYPHRLATAAESTNNSLTIIGTGFSSDDIRMELIERLNPVRSQRSNPERLPGARVSSSEGEY